MQRPQHSAGLDQRNNPNRFKGSPQIATTGAYALCLDDLQVLHKTVKMRTGQLRALGVTLLACALVGSAAASKLLVLLQEQELKSECSKFFGALEKAGISIDYQPYKDGGLKLRDYDTWLYDHLAIFAPKAEGALQSHRRAPPAQPVASIRRS